MSETLAQYQWKFRNNALAGAQEHSIGMSPVYDALNRLGLTPEFFPPGPGVPINLHDDVPDNTVVYVGSPDDIRRFGVFRRSRGSWHHVFGNQNYPEHTATISVLPGVDQPPDWLTRKAGKDEAEQIKRFKARCYNVGAKVRARTSWCGAYDEVMRRVGVDASSIQGVSGGVVGDVPAGHEVATLPEGSVLAWNDPDHPQRWATFRRDNNAQNTTRTQRHNGNRGDGTALGNWRAGSRVIWMPDLGDEEWQWSIPPMWSAAFLASVPVGTQFRYGGQPYHKAGNGRIGEGFALRQRGTWRIEDSFVNVQITVTGMESS